MKYALEYLTYAVKYYRNKKSLTGRAVARLFSQHGVCQLIADNYFLYHIESPDNMVADIDSFIATGSVPPWRLAFRKAANKVEASEPSNIRAARQTKLVQESWERHRAHQNTVIEILAIIIAGTLRITVLL